jgi:DNA-binding transcriptional LysR family regulator
MMTQSVDPQTLYLDLPLLRTFIAVVDHKSFSLAARELHRTQSAVSQQIKKLEQMVGRRLLNKHGREISLTEEGQLVYRYGWKMLQMEQRLKEELFSEEIAGRVRLGIPEDLATHYLLPILARFREQYPRIQLSVACDLTENLYRRYQASQYELVILKHEQLNVAHHDRIVKTWYDPLVWVGRDSQECQAWLTDRRLPVIVSPDPCVYRRQVLRQLAGAQLGADLTYVSESYNSKLFAIRAGLGLAALPQSLVPADCVVIQQGLPELSATKISLFRSEIQAKVAQYLQDSIVASFDALLLKR